MLNESLNITTQGEAGSAPTSGTECAQGKIVHDSRGNAVWQWGVATGVFARINANELLNMLENPTLTLEGECQLAMGEWSGDPYNRR